MQLVAPIVEMRGYASVISAVGHIAGLLLWQPIGGPPCETSPGFHSMSGSHRYLIRCGPGRTCHRRTSSHGTVVSPAITVMYRITVASCPLAAAVLPLLVDVFRIPETIRPKYRTKHHPEEQADMILLFPLFEQAQRGNGFIPVIISDGE
jgi:hypothetical protein